jgi:precorrin-6Y C5,15-methyltransferase (decarboxylating)
MFLSWTATGFKLAVPADRNSSNAAPLRSAKNIAMRTISRRKSLSHERLSVVGIGDDGWEGLSPAARDAIQAAEMIVGSVRHLALLPPAPAVRAERVTWPSPMLPYLDELLATHRSRAVAVLASGDPMLHGIGATLAQRLDASSLAVIPHVSAFALACARLGWPSADVALLSAVGRPLEALNAYLQPGRRTIVYSESGATPDAIATLLRERGFGPSALCVLEHVGGPLERRRDGIAASWTQVRCADLNVVAIACIPDAQTQALSIVPGLPDDAFEHDGQLTKRDVRAATLARLAPLPGHLLWDVGAGSGSIGIEWMRAHPSCRAIAFERNEERALRIARNARKLGVPGLRVICGSAPAAFADTQTPDSIFIGGGLASNNLLKTCQNILPPGGKLVANAVTLETEAILIAAHAAYGGELVRIAVSHAQALGEMRAWRPLLPITLWALTKA